MCQCFAEHNIWRRRLSSNRALSSPNIIVIIIEQFCWHLQLSHSVTLNLADVCTSRRGLASTWTACSAWRRTSPTPSWWRRRARTPPPSPCPATPTWSTTGHTAACPYYGINLRAADHWPSLNQAKVRRGLERGHALRQDQWEAAGQDNQHCGEWLLSSVSIVFILCIWCT